MYSFLNGESGLETFIMTGIAVAAVTVDAVAAAPVVDAGATVAVAVEAAGGVAQLVVAAVTGAAGLFTVIRSVFKQGKKKK